MSFVAGVKVGDYTLEEEIGRGGMGVVHRARDPNGVAVALKSVRAAPGADLSHLRREIHALSLVSHPGVVRVLDHGVHDASPWFAMELLRGHTLRVELDDVPDTPAEPADLAARWGMLSRLRDVCDGLAALHASNVVHRDLKPENVFVTDDGRAVLMDLGLAQFFPGTGRETLDRIAYAGTLTYASPEQLLGDFVDARSDLYSLGCVLYECLTGAPPFVVENSFAMLHRHVHVTPEAPSRRAPGVPAALDALVLRLLAKRPQDRFGYAADVARALDVILGAAPAEPAKTSWYIYRSPLVGRAELMRRLEGAVSDACKGRGAFVVLRGESGSGKTRLALELLQATQHHKALVIARGLDAVGERDADASPLRAFRPLLLRVADACRGLTDEERSARFGGALATLARVVPELAAAQPGRASWAPGALGAAGARERVLSAVVEVVRAVSAERPLVMVFDDLQWADELSREALRRLADDDLSALSLCVVAMWRAEEEGDALARLAAHPHVERHAVERFGAPDVARMVAGMLAITAPSDALRDAVYERTDGTPLFVAEYLRAAMTDGALRRDAQGAWALRDGAESRMREGPVPETLQGIIARRLAALPPLTRRVALCAGVLGRSFDEDLLAAVAGLDEARRIHHVEVLRRREVLEHTPPRTLRFIHDQVREAALASADPAALRALHLRAAEELTAREGDRDDAQAPIGRHWLLAGDARRAAAALERAGYAARAAYANADAAAHFRDALAALDALPDAPRAQVASVAEALGEASALSGQYALAREGFTRALDALPLDAPVARARALRKRAKTWEPSHQHAEALADYERAMAALGDDDGSAAWRHERVTVQVERVWVHYWLAQVDAMTALVERARGDVEAHGTAGLRARFYQAIVHQELRRGRYRIAPETVALARESARLAATLEDLSQKASASFLLGCVLAFAGDPEEGAAALTAARADAQRVGDVTLELRALTYLTVARRMCDDVEAVSALAASAQRLARRLAMPDYVGVAQANGAWARWRRGDAAGARAELDGALETWASIAGRYPYPMQWIARLPRIALDADAGRVDALSEHCDALLGPVQILLPDEVMRAVAVARDAPTLANARAVVEKACASGFL
ncbi:MAG: protein kinase [Polyangiales bacterium]